MTASPGEAAPGLRNTYRVMRHGRAVPNEAGIIVADPENGILPAYGLVAEGIEQAQQSSRASNLSPDTLIVSTDFSRGYQTAEILAEEIGADEIHIDVRLRERYFGDMELGSVDLYKEVWARDARSAIHTYRGVESLSSMADRQLKAVSSLEKKFAKRVIVLVGHADPLNVLKAALAGEPLQSHRTRFSIANGEIQMPTIAQKR